MITCPECNNQNLGGTAFCNNCGAALPPQSVATPEPEGAIVKCPTCGADHDLGRPFCDNCGASLRLLSPPPPGLRARLVVVRSGGHFDLSDKPDILVGREDPARGVFPDVDLIPHGGLEGGVGRRHARLIFRNNQWLIEDLLSTCGTLVNKQRLQPGVPRPLKDGDQIRLGRVELTFHTN